MKHRSKRFLSILLGLVLILGLLPGMSLMAYASTEFSISVSPQGSGSVSESESHGVHTFTPNPADGYVFDKWTYNDGWDSTQSKTSTSGTLRFTQNDWTIYNCLI